MSDQPPVPPTEPVPPVPPEGGGATWQGVQPVVERPTEVVPPVPPEPPPPAPPAGGRGGGPNRGLVIAIVIAALAVLGVGGFLLLGGDDDDDDVRAGFERSQGDDDRTTTTADEGDDEVDDITTTEADDGATTTAASEPGELAFFPISDDSGRLTVEVPDTWAEVDGTPLGDGAPNVQASTDLGAFRQLRASGISYTLLNQQNADPDATLDFLTSAHVDNCDVREREDYDDGVFTGRLQQLSDCGGAGVELVVIVASNAAGQSVEVSTAIVPPDPVNDIVSRIIETFNVTS